MGCGWRRRRVDFTLSSGETEISEMGDVFFIVFETVQALFSDKIFGFAVAGQSKSLFACSAVQSLL